MAVTILDIIKGISQVIADDGYDRYIDKGEEKKNTGLMRDKDVENKLLDQRIMDGFGVRFGGNILTLTYQSEVKIEDVKDPKFEGNIEGVISDLVKFLKKEYKNNTSNTLNLSEVKDSFECLVQMRSRRWSWVQAKKEFKINNVENVDSKEDSGSDAAQEKLDKLINEIYTQRNENFNRRSSK